MLGTSAFLLVTSVMAAVPTVQPPWFEFHDYPAKAFDKHWEGVTRFELLVDPSGKARKCTITETSGHEVLDTRTCALAMFRARFAPARGPGGEPTYGVFKSQAVWVIPEDVLSNTMPTPDLQVSINKLPDKTLEPPAVQLAYLTDPQGHVSSCTLLSGAPAQPDSLVDLGCREVASQLPARPETLPDGRPVAVVRTAAVLFTVDSRSGEGH